MQILKNLFRAFLRSHRLAGLFGRRPMPAAGPSTALAVPPALVQALQSAACSPAQALLQQLQTSAQGLGPGQARERLDRHGPNEVAHEKPLPAWLHLWHCYRNPFNLLLTLLAVVSYATEDEKATIVIASMVLLSTLLRFVQEGRSRHAAARLQALVGNRVTVRRKAGDDAAAPPPGFRDSGYGHDASLSELPMRELVPGDLVALSAGDMIPADCRVLSAKDLFVSQAAMTGESLPVEKDGRTRAALAPGQLLEAGNLLFMGTNVVSGSAMAVVVATGNQTYFGTLAARITHQDRTATAFEKGVNSVSWLLIRFAAVMVPVVLFINGYTKGDWGEAFLFALSVAVGLTPEMLPMIVTSTLAKGAVVLARQKVVVKRLDAIQNFGAMDVLCTDKTGTLTQDRIALERHTDVQGRPSDEVLQFAYLNSYYQTGLKNLLDRAVLEHVELRTRLHINEDYRKVDEIPFDFQRRRMSVVVAERNHHHELICKGAVEEILQVCTHIRDSGRDGDAVLPLTPQRREQVRTVTEGLNSEGLRVVAVAMKEVPPDRDSYGIADEAGLTLIGYVAFLDPPKESTQAAIAALLQHGVAVKVLTGDNERVARKVCRDVGLQVDQAVVGSDIEAMDEQQLRRTVQTHVLFARLTPLHKERIVHALRANGHITGFMGDGINDAPALRAADIGISVDSAVDIAREAADIILLEKSLMVLEQGVVEGRRTFSNMLKYIRMTASSNFGNVFSVLIASAFIPFLPMLPMQLLVQNLLYDISQIAIPFDNVDEEQVARPLRWNPQDLGRFMVFFGPISSLFDVLTFALMWFVFQADTAGRQTLFQSGWFVVGLLTQTLIVHMIRTPRIPFLQSRASWPLLATTAAIMAIGIFLPMGPLAGHFKLQALPPSYFPWLIVILLAYAVLTTLLKRLYIRKYGW
ncbi:magnesium-translocating P-type ATPase [Comamonas terrae]|uniref:Magnesium-transporting ATPase, P-type 1 n=1 Tax=Comamonas terrae TaxID=673548 RepID=A0ABW5UMY6_9BURK|nr:magnesium-translocating P-type ATPase [Comamonas terrae]